MMSRSVMMPSSVSPSITRSEPVCCAHIAAAAVLIDSDGDSVMLALVMTSLTYIGGSFASHDTLQTSHTTRVGPAVPAIVRQDADAARERHQRPNQRLIKAPPTRRAPCPTTPPYPYGTKPRHGEPHSQSGRTGSPKHRHERCAEPRPMTTTAHAPVTPPDSTSLGE